jgi:hypothetical protein
MTLAHSPYAPLNPFAPEPTGICDRCGFLYPLTSLVEQKAWAGPTVVKLGILVCTRTCLDELQQNGQRTIVIGPDPKPLKNPRPPRYKAQAGPDKRTFVLDDPADGLLDNPLDGL